MKPTHIAAGLVVAAAFLGGCSSTNETPATSSPTPTEVAITSWETWADHYDDKLKNCTGQTDPCFTENHLVIAEMRQSIVDNGLPIDGTHSGIANPMQLYQDSYVKFTEQNCIGAPQDFESSNVVCNVLRQQMNTTAGNISTALAGMA
ncbi:hypothetical protein [Gordonia alkanivorans]|uniref:hypothetical protein n=1 Tax=Gordonia alkanivorans TaxID=84096 RepID=UPI0024B7E0F6|nr:hypothetical protein [Gordonia alkanivorans]MDJ0010094.1 hypothetical protein [Gordonia alkanivorans]MDJ0495716.1 hypothetical protein [Gordonia alkanivorans]